jgi:hypothetical protein
MPNDDLPTIMPAIKARELAEYHDLIARKKIAPKAVGFAPKSLHASMKPHQAHSVDFALRAGRAALFLDTGLGKTFCALEWGREVVERTNKPVLMLAPLAVGHQHQREAEHWGIEAKYVRGDASMSRPAVWITNYEQLAHVDTDQFAGIILDESSILKSFTGKTTRELITRFAATPYRLACTATPAPNDHSELGNHAEFLGVMRREDMLVRWFLHDSADTGEWRLKKSAVNDFWSWVASWSRMVGKPSDLGFSNDGYDLAALNLHNHIIDADRTDDTQGLLFRIPDMSATSMHSEKRRTVDDRAEALAALVSAEPSEPWVIWCDTDYEADALTRFLPDFMDVRGSHKAEVKEERLVAFSTGAARGIITKPSIAGFGLNWQHCRRVGFVGLSFSYESFYQAVRRCWRFGQTSPVDCHVVMADTERAIYDAISRKRGDHETMKAQMMQAMSRASMAREVSIPYQPEKKAELPAWMKG